MILVTQYRQWLIATVLRATATVLESVSSQTGVRELSTKAHQFTHIFYVYVLRSIPSGRYYVGSTENTVNRLAEHNSGEVKATRSYRPWDLVFSESFETRSEAVRRERQIKSWKNPDFMVRKLGIIP